MLIGIQSSTGGRSGKDTVADMLQYHLEGIGRYAFAKPIKENINNLFVWNKEHSDGNLKEIKTLTFLPTPEQWIEVVGDYYRKHPEINSIKSVEMFGLGIGEVFDSWCFENNRVVMTVNDNLETKGVLLVNISPREVYQIFGTEMMRECISDSFWTDIAPTENVIITDVRFKNETEWLFDNGGLLVDVQRPNKGVKVAEHSSEAGTGVEADYIILNNGSLEELEDEVIKLADKLLRYKKECM